MNDTIKHGAGTIATFGLGVGGVSLQRVNEWGAFACWVLGCMAALCTIHSWWRKQKKRRTLQDLADSTTIEGK